MSGKPIRKRPRWRFADNWTSLSAEDGEWYELDIVDTEQGLKVTLSILAPPADDDAIYLEAERLADNICKFLNREAAP